MATSYQTADRMTFGRADVASDADVDVPISQGVIARATQAHDHEVYRARVVSAIAFLVATALAVGTDGATPNAMLGFLAISIASALSSKPLARHRFRTEIDNHMRGTGLSANDADKLARSITAKWMADHEGRAKRP
ncbi:MAG: hypothetical protein IPM54_07510 [Polyangiaceae bacterium]|nr:hypothetical protein [Polyangiaceae bacterium]